MSTDSFKVKNSLNIKPKSGATTEAGDIRTAADDSNRLKYNDGSGEKTVITSSSDLAVSKAVVTDGLGQLDTSATSATELGYVAGVTSAIQTQINGKQATGNYVTALTGDVVASGPGAVSATIQAGVVDNSKISNTAAIAYSKLNLTGDVVNADIATAAAIARSKIATGTTNQVVINDGSTGALSSEAQLAKSRGGTGADNSSVTFPSTGVLVTEAGIETLTNKTIAAGSNTISGIANANLSGSAAITNANLATMANNTVKGNTSGSTTTPSDVTLANTATASSVMFRDSNANTAINNINEAFATTATAAGTTTLTVSSAPLQQFTGTTTQTVNLPSASTLVTGTQFYIFNRSSGIVTVKDGGGSILQAMVGGTQACFTCAAIGSTAGSWDLSYTTTGTLPISLGGTGQTAKQAAFDALSPNATKGDVTVYNGTHNVNLGVGSNGQAIVADSTQANGVRWGNVAGSGSKNYISTYNGNSGNGDFELNATTGFSLGTVTLTSKLPSGVPTFGSGASGNLSLGILSTGNQLAGNFSLSYVSSAATTVGDFVATDAFTIDKEDQVKVLNWSFAYKGNINPGNANWSGTNSNSFAVAIYDVTNSVWIIPKGVFNLIQSAGVGIATGSFQTSSNGTSYRLVVYNANATSGTITVFFDDFVVGPAQVLNSASIVAARYTDTSGANVTTTPAVFKYLTVDYDTTSSYSTSTGLYTAPVSGKYFVQAAISNGAAAQQQYVDIYKNGSFFSRLANVDQTSANPIWTNGSDSISLNAGDTLGIYISADATRSTSTTAGYNHFSIFLMNAPLVGAAGQVVSSQAKATANISTTNGGVVILPSTVYDSTGSYNSSTGVYTVPISGYYEVTAAGIVNNGAVIGFNLQKNGAFAGNITGNSSNSGGNSDSGTFNVQCNAGDTLQVVATGTGGLLFSAGSSVATFTFSMRSGPSAANSQTASVNARYFSSASTITGSDATITYATKDFDTASAYSGGTYTIPVTGKYQINAALKIAGTFALNQAANISIYKNGTQISFDQDQAGGAVSAALASISDIISCVAGDLVTIKASSNATSPSISASNFQNYFSIALVGS